MTENVWIHCSVSPILPKSPKYFFRHFFGAVVVARCMPGVGVKDKCFGYSNLNSLKGEELGISTCIHLSFLSNGESTSLA